jgi:hypothetical protein
LAGWLVAATLAVLAAGPCSAGDASPVTSRPAAEASTSATPVCSRPVQEELQPVRIGSFRFLVRGSAWHHGGLDGPGGGSIRPNLAFLTIDVEAQNVGVKEQIVSPFKLCDELGGEHDQADNAWQLPGVLDPVESLAPGKTRRGRIVFDVPAGHRYLLLVRGGFQSRESALVRLSPCNGR